MDFLSGMEPFFFKSNFVHNLIQINSFLYLGIKIRKLLLLQNYTILPFTCIENSTISSIQSYLLRNSVGTQVVLYLIV
jgi:hypothetical protein